MQAPVKTERTALLVVDMQNGFCHPEGSAAKIGFDINMCQAAIEPCQRLIAGAREKGVRHGAFGQQARRLRPLAVAPLE